MHSNGIVELLGTWEHSFCGLENFFHKSNQFGNQSQAQTLTSSVLCGLGMHLVIYDFPLLDDICYILYSAQANIGGDDTYSFDERRIYNDQDLSDLVSIACEVLGESKLVQTLLCFV